MLKEVIELQNNAVNSLISIIECKDEITFKAPTGSGKTYMMADFMNRILENNKDVIFLVSSLSKGSLAQQNYDKFISYSEMGKFSNLNPYLINSEIAGEEALYIPTDKNVYVLPRDLYKKGGRLMQGAMEQFLNTLILNRYFGGMEKDIYLIKDECHVATNNLDNLSDSFFKKTINFSATPNMRRGQTPDVEITDEDAINAKLIKRVEFGDDEDTVEDAINKFEQIKERYNNKLGINPCLIIQISNKNKSDEELNNKIFPVLSKAEHQDLKWMLIVDKDKDCDTNDYFKAKKLPVSKWKEYAKGNTIDIIIFKMVISEGWDIPRACMLYQIRETQSEQLDEQVMGRVRRNPRLLDFENLDDEAKELALTSWIWGNQPTDGKKVRNVRLYEEYSDITNNLKIKTTKLKPLSQKREFNIDTFIHDQKNEPAYNDIFSMYKKLVRADNEIQKMCYDYADDYQKWWIFNNYLDNIITENNNYIYNYEESMEIKKDNNGNECLTSFPEKSSYVDNGNYENISDWVWKRNDGADKFSFDSEAEREWADFLKEISNKENINKNSIIKKVITGRNNPNKNSISLFEEKEKIDPKEKFLWGKNFISNSDIKYEYYLNGIYSSYPDFIMKDDFDRIHIFEVKSVNPSSNINIDSESYKAKIEELKKCYKQSSILTNYYFYLPVLKGDIWYITQFKNGEEFMITKEQFVEQLKVDEK